jgi:hypothetical protein
VLTPGHHQQDARHHSDEGHSSLRDCHLFERALS